MLTDELRQHLLDVAEENGISSDELIAAAEEELASRALPGDATPEGTGAPFEPHAYPFLRVNEIRERLGVPAAEDGDLWAGEWLAKHGGVLNTAPSNPSTSTKNQEN
jgi:hypothetical protein